MYIFLGSARILVYKCLYTFKAFEAAANLASTTLTMHVNFKDNFFRWRWRLFLLCRFGFLWFFRCRLLLFSRCWFFLRFLSCCFFLCFFRLLLLRRRWLLFFLYSKHKQRKTTRLKTNQDNSKRKRKWDYGMFANTSPISLQIFFWSLR